MSGDAFRCGFFILQAIWIQLTQGQGWAGTPGGILNGGSRQVARLISWSEEVDMMIADRDARFAELTRRVDKLEGRSPVA
jgi:hypothetical protein